MEITTCEQYVLAELESCKSELDAYKSGYQVSLDKTLKLGMEIDKLTDKLKTLQAMLRMFEIFQDTELKQSSYNEDMHELRCVLKLPVTKEGTEQFNFIVNTLNSFCSEEL